MIEKQSHSLNLWQALIFVLGILALQNVIYFVLVLVFGENFHLGIFASVILQFLTYLIAIYGFYWQKGHHFYFEKTNWVRKENIILLALGLAIFITFALTPIVELLPESEQAAEVFEELMAHPIFAIFVVIFFAPFFEELIFRGVLLRGLLAKYPPFVAVLISSLAFGAFHLNWQQFVIASFVGVFCALVYMITDSLLYNFIFHASYNFLVTFVVSFSGGISLEWWVRGLIILIAALVVALQIAVLYYSRPKIESEAKAID